MMDIGSETIPGECTMFLPQYRYRKGSDVEWKSIEHCETEADAQAYVEHCVAMDALEGTSHELEYRIVHRKA